jgi:hypothetical protein
VSKSSTKNKTRAWVPLHQDEILSARAQASVMVNDRYQIILRDCGQIEPFGAVIELSVKRLNQEPIFDWRDMQRIKNELFGRECEMVQVFPAESRLMDTSNQYWFYAFPSGYRIPLGWKERFLTEMSIGGSKQRPFRPEHREQNPDIGAHDATIRGQFKESKQ